MFGKRKMKRTWRCRTLDTLVPVSARQELVPEWDQKTYSRQRGLFIGAGGLNGEVCEGAVRKGLGELHIADFDIVTPSNLNRQKFVKRSLYKNKAVELCRILSKQGYLGSRLFAYPCSFQDLDVGAIRPDFGVCGVDNQLPETRLEVCELCFRLELPCVFTAVSTDADLGYVFVQEVGKACWACALKPELASGETDEDGDGKCPGVPAVTDILKALAGPALYAIDSLILERKRDWNYRVVSLSSDFGGSHTIGRRPDCPVCGGESRPEAGSPIEAEKPLQPALKKLEAMP